MAYDEALASRLRQALKGRRGIEEKSMFGGVAFMCRGHMCCGIVEDKLMVRVEPGAYDRLLEEPGARPMDFTGRPMRGFLFVTGAGLATAAALQNWIGRSLEFAESRPSKSGRPVSGRAAKGAKRRTARAPSRR